MQTACCQRWRKRRSSYRPAGEPIATRRWSVEAIADDRTARAFVVAHHYSGSYPAARRRFGLWSARGELAGVAVFSQPVRGKALEVVPGDPEGKAELGRFVLLDRVPANGESWMLARCFELLRADGWTGVVSFADPVARTRPNDGVKIFPGHVGTIYQATNAVYLGRSLPRTLRLLPDGTVLHSRAVSKIRKRERGWRYAAALLEAHGAAPLTDDEDAEAWLDRWRTPLTTKLRHHGNHKYAWAFSRRDRRHLPPSLAYPKLTALADPEVGSLPPSLPYPKLLSAPPR